jgi:hypothetical protein
MGHQLTAAFEDLADDVAELTHRVESVEARTLAGADAAGQRETEQREPEQCDYLVYLGTPSGYRLSENRGVPPEVGSSIVELSATVLRIGRSPFPGDPRTCIFAIS